MSKPSSKIRWLACSVVALATIALGGRAGAQPPVSAHKYDEVIRAAVARGETVRAIVRFKNHDARMRGASVVSHLGGRVRGALNDVQALAVEIDAATAAQLSADEGTLTLSVDATVRSAAAAQRFSSVVKGASTAAARQGAGKRGRSVAVAVIDSGVQPHADLPMSRIRTFVDFVNGRSRPYDDFGHGTHVAGIIAGDGSRSSRVDASYAGVAPEADIVALKVLDGQGAGRTSDVIAALEWVARNHTLHNIRVVNLSLGHPVYEPAATDPLVQAAEALVARGIVVVASAGNLGTDPQDGIVGSGGITSPANGPRVIAVGAADSNGTSRRSDDTVAQYSSRGPTRFDLLAKPDIVAPAHRIVSLSAPGSYLFANYPDLHVATGRERVPSYMMLTGTSMAAPAVSGAAARMIDVNPGLSASGVRALLEFTAQRLDSTNVLAQGAGQLNAHGAVRLAGMVNPTARFGSIWLAGADVPDAYDMLFGEPVPWAKNIIWGNRVLLGDSAYLNLPAWANNIVWGQAADNIVWGQCGEGKCDNAAWRQNALENIVWGQCATSACDNIVWGQAADNIVWGQRGEAFAYWSSNTVWGFWDAQVEWSSLTQLNAKNIVWGQDYLQNIVWGQDNIVWGQDNIVWGQSLHVLTLGGLQ